MNRALPFLVPLLPLALACGPGTSGPPPQPGVPTPTAVGRPAGVKVTASLGPAGGRLASLDGRLTVDVPAGALASTTELGVVALNNAAHGGVGQSFRLTPDGQTFAQPVTLTFKPTAEEVAAAPLPFLDVGYQLADKRWVAFKTVTRDAAKGTVSAQTTHFTDFSLLAGYQLQPADARVRTGQRLDVRVAFCDRKPAEGIADESLVSLVAECGAVDSEVYEVTDWSVNGTPNGSAAVGTLAAQGATATYTAPGSEPTGNPVAVSARPLIANQRTLLVSNVRVVGGPAWSGVVDSLNVSTGGNTVVQLSSHATVTFTLDATTQEWVPEGAVTVVQRTQVLGTGGCVSEVSGTVPVHAQDGTLSLIEDFGTAQYQGFGSLMLTLNGTSNCNSNMTTEPATATTTVQFLGFSGTGLLENGTVMEGTQVTGGGGDSASVAWQFLKTP